MCVRPLLRDSKISVIFQNMHALVSGDDVNTLFTSKKVSKFVLLH